MSTYQYIQHHTLRQRRFDKTLTQIEARLQKLGLKGKTERLLQLSDPTDVATRLLARAKSETLVVLGDDSLFIEVMNAVIAAKQNITLGYIPMFTETNLTTNLGLSLGERAVETLAGRIARKIDIGSLGHKYFIDSLEIQDKNTVFIIDKKYTVSPGPEISYVKINNLSDRALSWRIRRSISPSDGLLDLTFVKEKQSALLHRRKTSTDTLIQSNNIKISSVRGSEVEVIADNQSKIKTPLTVGLLPQHLSLIVGKARSFS